jgi:hypothetical protein
MLWISGAQAETWRARLPYFAIAAIVTVTATH